MVEREARADVAGYLDAQGTTQGIDHGALAARLAGAGYRPFADAAYGPAGDWIVRVDRTRLGIVLGGAYAPGSDEHASLWRLHILGDVGYDAVRARHFVFTPRVSFGMEGDILSLDGSRRIAPVNDGFDRALSRGDVARSFAFIVRPALGIGYERTTDDGGLGYRIGALVGYAAPLFAGGWIGNEAQSIGGPSVVHGGSTFALELGVTFGASSP